MNRSNLLRRLLGGISVIAIVAIITFSGCTDIDTSLGSDLTLDNQSLKVGQMNIDCREGNYFESRLYKSDSLNSACVSYGYLGRMGNDTFGTRWAGFYTQYVPNVYFDEDDDDFDGDIPFGYMPIFDSAVLYLAIESYGGDTTIPQKYEVYEVVDDTFVYNSADSIFFPTFDIDPYLGDKPVFTFTFPDAKNGVYISNYSVTMQNTDYTADFINKLMLVDLMGDYDYEIYDDDEEWVEYFKGLYIRPVEDLEPITAGDPGGMYAMTLSSSGFGFYGRSREQDDPTLIKDTIDMSYVFYWEDADAGNVSINLIDHNYEGSMIDIADVRTSDQSYDATPLVSTLRIEGLSGVVSQITLTEEFFEQLDTILDAEEAETGELFTSLFFNQAKLKIYMNEVSSYDYTTIDPYLVTPWMNVMPTTLGLYTDYSYYYVWAEDDVDYKYSYVADNGDDDELIYVTLTGIEDYLYPYESTYTLDFGGEMNRSWGCYVMNISAHVQSCWNLYLDAKEEAETNGTEINWDDVSDRTMYLAPTASNLNSFEYASLQAGDGELNSAPIYLELTYTMIR